MGKRGKTMNSFLVKTGVIAMVLAVSGTALAESNFGLGVKAGTLGIGVEGTWRPVPVVDIRLGINQYEYDYSGRYEGIDYNGTLNLDTLYGTVNFKFPLSPFRVTVGAYSNSNEFTMASAESGSFEIGGTTYTSADIGSVTATASFPSTAPYLGFGFDFSLGGKVGLNLDFGVMWQGEPTISMMTDGLLASDSDFLASVEAERLELQNEVSDYKAWPVLSLGFVFNF